MRRKPLQVHTNKGAKGQAAMEFLLTYGWAILIVLIVIAALAYFGVLSPKKLLPGKCLFQVGLQCADFSASSKSLITTKDENDEVVPVAIHVADDLATTQIDESQIDYYVQPLAFNLINRLGKRVYVVGLEVVGKAKDYNCMEFKLDCPDLPDGTSSDFFENAISSQALAFVPGRMCVSLRKICGKEGDECYDFAPGRCIFEKDNGDDTFSPLGCDPEKLLVWEPDTKLVTQLEKNSPFLNFIRLISPQYLNFYCLSLPKKGERVDAQIVVTYTYEGKADSLTHQAYGELSTTVS